jgi:transposase-like protein
MNKCKAPVLGIIINRVILPWMTGEYSFSRLRKIRRRSVRDQGSERGRGTTKQPAFGILCRNGTVRAEVVDNVGSDTLQPLISQKVSAGSIVCSDTWKAYNGIASRGYVHRLVNHAKKPVQRWKRRSYPWPGGIPGIPGTKTGIERWYPTRKSPSLLRGVRREIQSQK